MSLSTQCLFAGYYVLWVIVPLIPAVLTYWLFPNTSATARGSLCGLTVSMTGAFAAYVIVFILTRPIIIQMEDALSSSIVPMWQVNAKVSVQDEHGNEADPRLLEALAVDSRPPNYDHSNQLVEIWVPEHNNLLPKLMFKIDQFGSTAINLEDPTLAITRNTSKRKITIDKAITIKRFPDAGAGVSQLPVSAK